MHNRVWESRHGDEAWMRVEETVRLEDRLTLTVADAAKVAGLPEKVIRREVRSGELASFTRDSATRRIKRAELDDWIRIL